MNYMTIKEAAEKWSISGRMVTYYCVDGHIDGIIRKGNMWLVPADAEKPADGRYNENKKVNDGEISTTFYCYAYVRRK